MSASHREGDGGKLSHCLHGETLERQPEMFDKAPEKRSLNRYTAVKRVCNLSVFNGTVKQQWLTKDFAVCPRSSFSNCAKAQERQQKLTGVSTPVLVVRSRDVAAITAAVLLLLCCCFCCSTIRDAPRKTIRNADPHAYSCKKVSLRCSIFFIWRSGLTRGAGTKNSNSTSPPPLLLCCCCCAAAAVLLLLLLHDPRFIAAPRSAMLIRDAYTERFPKKMFRFGVPFPSFGVLVFPGVL